jgi:hypothetical protein
VTEDVNSNDGKIVRRRGVRLVRRSREAEMEVSLMKLVFTHPSGDGQRAVDVKQCQDTRISRRHIDFEKNTEKKDPKFGRNWFVNFKGI